MSLESAGLASLEEQEKETMFERYAEQVADDGFEAMRKNHGPESEAPKVFHTIEHPEEMIELAKEMEDTFGVPAHGRAFVKGLIAHHDSIILFDKADPANILARVMRHRGARKGDEPSGSGGNEALSADGWEKSARKANEDARREGADFDIFSEADIKKGRLGIEFTYPGVTFGPFSNLPHFEEVKEASESVRRSLDLAKMAGIEGGLVFLQPHFDNMIEAGEKIPTEALIVALADLGQVGAKGYEFFRKSGDKEFRELSANLSRSELHRLANGDAQQDSEDREKVIKGFEGWIGSQISFALGQMIRFEKNLIMMRRNGQINEDQEQGLRRQFSHFEENIKQAIERRDRFTAAMIGHEKEKETFRTAAEEMGYEDFDSPKVSG